MSFLHGPGSTHNRCNQDIQRMPANDWCDALLLSTQHTLRPQCIVVYFRRVLLKEVLLNGETMTAIWHSIKKKKKTDSEEKSMNDYQRSVRLPKKQAFFTFWSLFIIDGLCGRKQSMWMLRKGVSLRVFRLCFLSTGWWRLLVWWQWPPPAPPSLVWSCR